MLLRVQELRERLASKMKRLGFDDTFSPNDPGSNGGGPSTQTPPPLPNSISSNSISSTTASTKAGTTYQCEIRASNLDPTVIAGNIFLATLRGKTIRGRTLILLPAARLVNMCCRSKNNNNKRRHLTFLVKNLCSCVVLPL